MGWVREQPRWIVAVLAVAAFFILFGWFVVRPTVAPTIGQDQAIEIAREFYTSADAHGAAATTSNVTILGVDRTIANGRSVWRVEITGDVTEAGRTSVTYMSAMLLDVDAETGAVTVFAQG